MSILRLDRLLKFLAGIEPAMAVLWLGLAIFTVGLAILLYTRWGQYKPLRKCMAMSLLAHLLLAGYATTIEIVGPMSPPAEQTICIALGDGPDERAAPGGSASALSSVKDQPWEVFPSDAVVEPGESKLERGTPDEPAEPSRLVRAEDDKLPGGPPAEHVALPEVKPLKSKLDFARAPVSDEPAAAIEAPAAQRRDVAPPTASDATTSPPRLASDALDPPTRALSGDVPAELLEPIVPLPKIGRLAASDPFDGDVGRTNPMRTKPAEPVTATASEDATENRQERAALVVSGTRIGPSAAAGVGGNADHASVPDAYRLRVAPNRAGVVQSHGGTAETEATVKRALRWLADNQAADGRWNPREHEAGKETNALGRNRQSAGGRADSGMTGLALLAFLAAGHTHVDGPYQDDVRRGLEYLLETQSPDGNLGGQAAAFEQMYCHAMATCALSEAYGMTRDDNLREPVRRAIGYTVAAQDPRGGSWRYRPGDPGDTSQLGWQLMSLKSAELAGIPMPEQTRQGIIRYLQSVSSGQYGGRASYRPGEQATRPMTAEALACWQFLGLARGHPACSEAGEYIIGELPGAGLSNVYYWYYATLGLYQLQDERWQRWNEALRAALVARQLREGPLAGSWDTNDLWGSYGGRVFTTALATLTLEVYYRFLPIYVGVTPDKRQTR